MSREVKRYQECNWLVKLWRRRWYLLIPFQYFYYTHIKEFRVYRDEIIDGEYTHTDNYDVMSGKNLRKLLVGIAQGHMHYYWTMDEVEEKFKEFKEERKTKLKKREKGNFISSDEMKNKINKLK